MEADRDELYKAAELAYMVLQEGTGISLDPAKIKYKLQQLNRGRPVESEFAALALWSGRCRYIHKLDRDTLPKSCPYEIPDFLCFLDIDGRTIPVLIEVKASKNKLLKFSRKYYSALTDFAAELRLPMLIAFKFTGLGRPLWALFELQKMATARGTGNAHIFEVMRHDLLGVLFSNFHFQIRQGAALAMKISKNEVKKDDSGSIVSMVGRIEDVYWETPEGKHVEWVSLLDVLFMLSEDDVRLEEYSDYVIQKFYKVHDDATIAYWALPLAASRRKYFTGETIPWNKVIRDQGFAFSLVNVERAVEKAQNCGLAGPVIYTRPQEMPYFLGGG